MHQNLLLFSARDTSSQKLLAKKIIVSYKSIYLFKPLSKKSNNVMICIRYWYFVQSLHECFIERCCKSNKLLQKEFQRIIYCLYDDLYEQGHHFSYSFEASRTFGQGPSDTRGKSVTGPPRFWQQHELNIFLRMALFFC